MNSLEIAQAWSSFPLWYLSAKWPDCREHSPTQLERTRCIVSVKLLPRYDHWIELWVIIQDGSGIAKNITIDLHKQDMLHFINAVTRRNIDLLLESIDLSYWAMQHCSSGIAIKFTAMKLVNFERWTRHWTRDFGRQKEKARYSLDLLRFQ